MDIHALGIILWELLVREHPYEEFNFEFNYQVDEAIRKGQRPTIPPPSEGKDSLIEEEYGQLIGRCWAPFPRDRPTAHEVCTVLSRLLAAVSA